MKTNNAINSFKWIGNKRRYLDKIYKYVNEHDIFVDVFGGSGSVIINKPIKAKYREVYNDIDETVVNYFRVVKDKEKHKELMYLVSLTPHHPKEFEEAMNIFKNKENYTDIELAWAFFVSVYMSYNGNRERFSPEFTKNNFLHLMESRIKNIHKKILNIQFVSLDYIELMEKLDNERHNILFFLDPPYITEKKFYNKSMNKSKEHENFVEFILDYSIRNPNYQFILTSYEDEAHNKLTDNNWRKEHYVLYNNMANSQDKARCYDCIFTSPNIKMKTGLFDE